MPLSLPPLSRRHFLAQTFAAAAAAAVWKTPALRAQNPAGTQETWALFSDTHIPANRELVVRGVNSAESLSACVKATLGWNSQPGGVLVCGDCASVTGEIADYEVFGELIQPLREAGLPVHLLLGNHDHREHFVEALGRNRATPSPVEHRQVAVISGPVANWFLLDSLDVVNKAPGMLGDEQRAWLEKALDTHPDKPAMVMVHHDIFRPAGKANLEDAAELLAILRPRKQVKACFYGHTHQWGVDRDESGIHLINLPSVAAAFGASRPRGWVHATLREEALRLELRCVESSHPQHGHVAELPWRA